MKKEVVLIILILVAIFALLSFTHSFNAASADDAKKFFAEDLQDSYPTADARVIQDVTQIGSGADAYYVLTAAVSYNLSTPCPVRIEVEYDYPSRNFVKRNDTLVSGCQVCESGPNCLLSYPEEAIIASHTYNGTASVTAYLTAYPAATPTAALLDSYNGEHNVWEVNWSDPAASDTLTVHLSQAQNQVIDIQTVAQTPAPAANASQ